eukprot:scaffold34730_cov31-Tisochrysis_lutea.AAC.1
MSDSCHDRLHHSSIAHPPASADLSFLLATSLQECNQAQDDAQTRKPTSTFLGLKKAAKKVAVAVVKTTKAAVVTPLHAAVAGGQKLSLQHGGAITRAREAKVMREMQAKKAKIQKEFEKLHRDLSDVEQKRAEAAAQAQASTAQAQQAERDRQRLEANSVQEQARYHELQREADALAKKQSRRKRAEEDEERRAAKFELKIRELKATSRAESTVRARFLAGSTQGLPSHICPYAS